MLGLGNQPSCEGQAAELLIMQQIISSKPSAGRFRNEQRANRVLQQKHCKGKNNCCKVSALFSLWHIHNQDKFIS